jgi:hypothetical protein
LNRTPLKQHHRDAARQARHVARQLERWSADFAAKGQRVQAEYYADLAEAVAYCAAVTEATDGR